VAYNYILALKQHDDERAYGYLSPDLPGYPPTIDEFAADIDRSSWSFNRESATISISDERITNNHAVVIISETRFYENGLFSSRQYSNPLNMTLERQGSTWKLRHADVYWYACWAERHPCP
jgi:hypothetical protein